MAKYLSTTQSYINGEFVKGTVEFPAIITLPDDVEPSRKFQALDAAGLAALQKLENRDAVAQKREPRKLEMLREPEEPKRKTEEVNTMSQMAGHKAPVVGVKRPNDKSPM